MGDSTLQAFRAQWSSKVVAIPTRLDPKNGQPIIRWKDVIQYFQNAECIMNGEHMVLFLTDENLEDE
ncbi:hypothetical protein BGX31_006972 [Mortierella sp. GBA43]|nr:hypothetical protein BGX31_006972 [Mortierella sp. GBA43]